MNTYDPANYILYVHMDKERQTSPSHMAGLPAESRPPSGYADGSPRTTLRNGTPVRPARSNRRRLANTAERRERISRCGRHAARPKARVN